MEKLTQYFKEQEDPFYKKGQRLGFSLGLENGKKQGIEQGKKQGIEQGKFNKERLVVLNLLKETNFSPTEIARLAEVPIDFVETLKKESGA